MQREQSQHGSPSLVLQPGAQPAPGYCLLERIGGGGYGEVWKAEAQGGFQVALKFVRVAEEAGAVEARALEIIKAVHHPNLLVTFGAWRAADYLVIAMELADCALWDRYRECVAQGLPGIPHDELIEYFAEAAKGIDHLNEHKHYLEGNQRVGIQHRDIKPQNILLVGGGVKVADFGLARLLTGSVTGHTGHMTLSYAAPEFFKGQTSSQSDQYSLAVTYIQLRTGRLPFRGNLGQIASGHLLHAPDLEMLPAAERGPVARALAKEPDQRWPNCRAFVAALRRATGSEAEPTPVYPVHSTESWAKMETMTVGGVKTTPERTRTRRPEPGGLGTAFWVLAACALLLVSVAAAGASLWAFGLLRLPGPADTGSAVVARGSLTVKAPPTVSLRAGARESFTVQVQRTDLKGPVELTFAGHPSGVTFKPATVPADKDAAQVTVEAAADAGVGEVAVEVRAAGGEVKAEAPFTLKVLKAAALSVETPVAVALRAGGSKKVTVKITRDGVDGPVTVRFRDAPPAVILREVTIPAQENSVDVDVTALDFAAPANQAVTVITAGNGTEAQTTFRLVLEREPRLTVEAPKTFSLNTGDTRQLQVRLVRDGVDGPVRVRFEGLPEGVTVKEVTVPAAGNVANVEVTADGSAKEVVDSPVTVIASGGFARGQASLNLTVKPAVMVDHLAHYERANGHYERKEYAQAIAAYTEAIRLNPRFANAYVRRGDAYDAAGEYQKAVADYDKAIELNPKDAVAHNNRGYARAERGELDRAIQDYNRAIELNDQDAVFFLNRGNAFLNKSDYNRAIPDYDRAIALNPKNAVAYNQRGNCYFGLADYNTAVANYGKALELNPRYPLSFSNRAHAYLMKKDYDLAIADCNQALAIDPKYHLAYKHRGNAYAWKEDYVRAIADYDKAIELKPDEAQYYTVRGNAYVNKGDYDRGIEDHDKAIQLDGRYAEAYSNRASAFVLKKEYNLALDDATKAIELSPRWAPPYKTRGDAYSWKEQWDEAIADYTEAIKLSPNHEWAYNGRGVSYYYKKDYVRALADFTEAIRIDPRNPRFYRERANTYEATGDAEKARVDRETAERFSTK